MKIKVDLLKIGQDQDSEKMARVCAVALLSALPWDAAQMAVDEWRAVHQERLAKRGDQEPSAVAVEAAVDPMPVSVAANVTAAVDASTAGDGPLPDMQEHVEHPGLTAPRRVPDYKVGGWVVTDLGELVRIIGIKDQTPGPGRTLRVEFDDGEQIPSQKTISVGRVRPATVAEVTAGAAREAMVTTTPAAQPVPDRGEKKKRGRPKKAEPVAVQSEAVAEPKHDPYTGDNVSDPVKAAKYAKASLKDLCKLAVHHTNPGVVAELCTTHGAGKYVKDMTPAEQASLRAAVLELVP